jgi:uncharacterized protein (TIGR01777 family)
MDVLVAGGTGFLGRPLCAALVCAGHRVVVLSRDPARARPGLDGAVQVLSWDPARADGNQPWVQQLGQADAIINLAGESVGGQGPLPVRWSPAFKARLRASRLDATQAIVQAIAATPIERRPRVLVNASAIGYYGDRGDEVLAEDSPPGRGFFANLCLDWEAAAQTAEDLGTRVVRLRTGIVLERGAMAADLLILASHLGVGGPLGSGRQWWSWIHRADVVGLILHALRDDDLHGPLNLVAPTPRPMRDFPRVLGRLLHRPSLVPAPAFALRIGLGEVADALLLASQRVMPGRALQAGYTFRYPTLENALAAILEGRQP